MSKTNDSSKKDALAESKPKEDNYILSDIEKLSIDDAWNQGVDTLKEIIKLTFKGELDGRSKQGMAVKEYLASQNKKAVPGQVYQPKKNELSLTEEQKEFIANNAASMKPLEITKTIFNNAELCPLNNEFKIVNAYYKSLDPGVRQDVSDEDLKEYSPPKQEAQAVARVNKYVKDGIKVGQLDSRQREYMTRLIKFMHTHRFLQEIIILKKNSERETFESAFVRFTWDKPDLTEEEIDLYLNYCSDAVRYARMKEEEIELKEFKDQMMAEDGKIPMAIVESLNKLRSDIDEVGKKQEKTLHSLNGKRSDRLEKIREDNSSILSVIEAFRVEEKRKRFIDVIEARKVSVEKEADRLADMDDLIFDLFGASKSELT